MLFYLHLLAADKKDAKRTSATTWTEGYKQVQAIQYENVGLQCRVKFMQKINREKDVKIPLTILENAMLIQKKISDGST